jgi:hypothetical protein
LQPDPITSKPVKTASGMLRRVRKSVLMGKSSILDFGRARFTSLDEGKMRQAGARCANNASHYCLPIIDGSAKSQPA